MGFLDNSGDIILDAVLTDTGRFRLAKGDGSFKITKFALGDDEINYSQYDKNNASGSAYYDFNEQTDVNARYSTNNSFLVAVDQTTEDDVALNSGKWTQGILAGQTLTKGNFILLEQGLNTTEIPDSVTIDSDLVETQYIVEIDNRFAKIATVSPSSKIASPSYIDDDNIASYYFSLSQNNDYVLDSWTGKINPSKTTQTTTLGIQGPKGTRFQFMIASSLDLSTSTYLFDTLGSSGYAVNGSNCYFIDSNIRIIGGTTGYTMDIPVRYIKKQ